MYSRIYIVDRIVNNINLNEVNKMQVTTNITTAEQAQTSDGTNFKITIFEQKITAFCDLCPNQATGTQKALEVAGWHCGEREQFCPECN